MTLEQLIKQLEEVADLVDRESTEVYVNSGKLGEVLIQSGNDADEAGVYQYILLTD